MARDTELDTERLTSSMSLSNLAERLKAQAVMVGPAISLNGDCNTPAPEQSVNAQPKQ